MCGKAFSIEHALSCLKKGYPSLRHNKIRVLTAEFVSEVCHNVCTEPTLQSLPGEALTGLSSNRELGTRLDIATDGFGGSDDERAYFDIRVFNPLPSRTDQHLWLQPIASMSIKGNANTTRELER